MTLDPPGSSTGPGHGDGRQNPPVHPTTAEMLSSSLSAAPGSPLVAPSFDSRRELAELLFHRVHNSLIYPVAEGIDAVFRGLVLVQYDDLPAAFSDKVKDPRGTPNPNPAWSAMSSAEKLGVISDRLGHYADPAELQGGARYNLPVMERFFDEHRGMLRSIAAAASEMPADSANQIQPATAELLRIFEAHVQLFRPENIQAVELNPIIDAAVALVPVGPRVFPSGFIIRGDVSADLPKVLAQHELFVQSIAEAAMNSYQAAYYHEAALKAKASGGGEPTAEDMQKYNLKVSAKTLADGRAVLILEDNGPGFAPSMLARDLNGIPERPYLCNGTASSGTGGQGCCEMYYLAFIHHAELRFENYQDGERSGARISIIFPPAAAV